MIIWRTPVSGLQFFGYSIALGGLMYYRFGADGFKEAAGQASRAWAEYGVNHPALRKMIVFGLIMVTIFVLVGGLAPTFAPEASAASLKSVKGLLGGAAAGVAGTGAT